MYYLAVPFLLCARHIFNPHSFTTVFYMQIAKTDQSTTQQDHVAKKELTPQCSAEVTPQRDMAKSEQQAANIELTPKCSVSAYYIGFAYDLDFAYVVI